MTVHNLMRRPELEGADVDLTLEAAQATPKSIADELAERTTRVAKVAALHAEEVDRDARFPREAITAAKALGLMGIMAPAELGGEGASLSEVADICYALGRACASTAMIYAMHQVKVACVIRHGVGSEWHEAFIGRLVRDQLLLASSTTGYERWAPCSGRGSGRRARAGSEPPRRWRAA